MQLVHFTSTPSDKVSAHSHSRSQPLSHPKKRVSPEYFQCLRKGMLLEHRKELVKPCLPQSPLLVQGGSDPCRCRSKKQLCTRILSPLSSWLRQSIRRKTFAQTRLTKSCAKPNAEPRYGRVEKNFPENKCIFLHSDRDKKVDDNKNIRT